MTHDAPAAIDLDPTADLDLDGEGHGPFERLQTWLSLRRPGRAGTVIRIVFAVGIAWAPLVALTASDGKLFGPAASEPFARELKLNAALLVAMPLFALSMTSLYLAVKTTALHFVRSGLIAREDVPLYHDELKKVARLRDSWLVQMVVVALVLGLNYGTGRTLIENLPGWAVDESAGVRVASAAGHWSRWVARPIFSLWLGMSVYRWVVYVVLMWRLSRLPLRLVPTHPDGCGGLAFMGALPKTFGVTVAGLATVLSASCAAGMIWHKDNLESVRDPILFFVVSVVVLLLGPMLLFAPRMAAARKQAALDYGALSARHARLFEERWVKSGAPDDDLLSAPEISTLCDIDAPLSRVVKMATVPVSRSLFMAILLPAVLPCVPVVLIEIPLVDLLKQVGGKLL